MEIFKTPISFDAFSYIILQEIGDEWTAHVIINWFIPNQK